AQLGVEQVLRQGNRHELFLQGDLGFYYHRHLRTAVYLTTQFGYRWRAGRWHLSLAAGPGLSLAFATRPVYVFAEGTYRAGRNGGTLLFTPALSLEAGYRIGKSSRAPELLLHYGLAVDTPFAILPLPHLLTGIGLRFTPFNRRP
ncbi:MAG: hypothetical protein AAFZ52_05395, partial [Bacteroidota bacterium]